MAAPSLEIRGLGGVQRRLRQLAEQTHQDIGPALYAEAEIDMTEAKVRTPVYTGALRASGHVTPPLGQGLNVSVSLIFGGPGTEYAVPVHENMEAFHPTGQAKFLESVLLESAPHLAERVAVRLKL